MGYRNFLFVPRAVFFNNFQPPRQGGGSCAGFFFLKKKTKESLINIGTDIEKSITEYAKFIMKHLGVNLKIIYEKKTLDGTFRKLLDVSLAKKYGWKYKTNLDVGLSNTINDYLKKYLKENK